MLERYAKLEQNRLFLGIKLILDAVLAYIFGSLAIDTGRYLHYFVTILFLGFFVRTIILFTKTYDKK